MSAERASYLHSSAIVKLVIRAPESDALRRYLRRHTPLVASALARTEVLRTLLPIGHEAMERGEAVLGCIELIRISDDILGVAGSLGPFELRASDAIHLATASYLGSDLARVVTYDENVATTARSFRLTVVAPA